MNGAFNGWRKAWTSKKWPSGRKKFIDAEAMNPDDFHRYDQAAIAANKAYVSQMESEVRAGRAA